jgi:glutamyl-Q tRNA(Asp) synthetase
VLAESVGDFVLRRADGLFAYQLAVVVDDAAAGVNQVVRGADLLSSTPRQIFLHACLGTPVPAYIHLPLVIGHDGKKISKRNDPDRPETPRGGTQMIAQALHFLGQKVPGSLLGAPPKELLSWAVQYFDQAAIPPATEGLPFSPF